MILSNATVRWSVGPAFYVQSVSAFPIANGTYGGDYFALLYQLNGTRIIGAFVDTHITAVLKSYTDTRGETFCYGSTANSTICFTSPWSAGNVMA